MQEGWSPIRYRLPVGDRFAIDASTHEVIEVGGEAAMDVHVAFALACEVVDEDDGIVRIAGRFVEPHAQGRAYAGMLPDVGVLDGTTITVHKGVDGRVHGVEGASGVEELFGGLTAANALRWFAAVFPQDAAETWTVTDRWILRSDRTPLGVDLPLRPTVSVGYRYTRRSANEMDLAITFSGGGSSDVLGLEVGVSGQGTGTVVVDLDRGKLASSEKQAVLRLVPRAVRRGALALPELVVRRRSRAGFRDTPGA